jgi:hypothetical protein
MKTLSLILSIISLAVSICLGLFIFQNKSSEPIQVDHLAKALGYTWHPIVLENRTEKMMISLETSGSGDFKFQGGSTLPAGNLFLFDRVKDSKIEYSNVGKNGTASGSRGMSSPSHGNRASVPTGEPIRLNQVIMSIGDKEASLPADFKKGQIGIALVSKG